MEMPGSPELRDTPEYAAAWDMEMWRQSEMVKHQRALAAHKKQLQGEWRAAHEKRMKELEHEYNQKFQELRKLQEKANVELRTAQRQKEHLQQSARLLSKTIKEKEEEYQKLVQECDVHVRHAQEAELHAKEMTRRMEGVNVMLTEKVATLQQQCLDLRQKVAELQGLETVHKEIKDQYLRSSEQHQKEIRELQSQNDAMRQELAAAKAELVATKKGLQSLTEELQAKDQQLQTMSRQLQKAQRAASTLQPPQTTTTVTGAITSSAVPVAPVHSPLPANNTPAPPVSPVPVHNGAPHCCHTTTTAPLVVVHTDRSPSTDGSTSQVLQASKLPQSTSSMDCITAELLRLQKEKDALLHTGVYGEDDAVIQQLTREINTLQRVTNMQLPQAM